MIRRPPRSTLASSSAASDVYKRQLVARATAEPRATRVRQRAVVVDAHTVGATDAFSGGPSKVVAPGAPRLLAHPLRFAGGEQSPPLETQCARILGTGVARVQTDGVTTLRHCTQDRTHLWLVDTCLLYTSDAADEEDSVDLGGRRI